MSDTAPGTPAGTPQVLLAHHLKALKLPTFLREYDKLARQCATDGVDHVRYLLRLAELELIERERRMVERRIKEAKFPAVKSLDSFDFLALPSLNKVLVLELARSEYVLRRENVIAVGNSGTGKTHIALGLGLAACQKGLSVGFTTAAALVHELIEARDDKRLLRLQRQLAGYKLLVIDELGYVPLSQTGAELLFEVFSQRYERSTYTSTDHRHQQSAVRRVDQRVRFRTAHRRAARPPHAPRPHPRDERRQLPAETKQAAPARHTLRRDPGYRIRGMMPRRAVPSGFRDVTLRSGTMPRKSIGERPMTDAERQARHRTARAAGVPVSRARRPADRRSRARRWHDAVAELAELQAQYAAWLDALPDNQQDGATADALRAICDLDLVELQAIEPPRGFGRD